MTIKGDLYQAILEKSNKSPATISRWAADLIEKHGPMTADEARLVIAHEFGVDLNKYPVSPEQLDKVRTLRSSGASLASVQQRAGGPEQPASTERGDSSTTAQAYNPRPMTPAALFHSRGFHPAVAASSKRRFVNGHRSDAIRATFQAVNNRVKKLSGLHGRDGQALMGQAFTDDDPPLQMTNLATQSERDEHAGARLLMMGAMTGLRNPRAHEDGWEPDNDEHYVLECLAFASLLHRFLDRCEEYRGTRPK